MIIFYGICAQFNTEPLRKRSDSPIDYSCHHTGTGLQVVYLCLYGLEPSNNLFNETLSHDFDFQIVSKAGKKLRHLSFFENTIEL